MWSDNDRPKRLSLRERMALKCQQEKHNDTNSNNSTFNISKTASLRTSKIKIDDNNNNVVDNNNNVVDNNNNSNDSKEEFDQDISAIVSDGPKIDENNNTILVEKTRREDNVVNTKTPNNNIFAENVLETSTQCDNYENIFWQNSDDAIFQRNSENGSKEESAMAKSAPRTAHKELRDRKKDESAIRQYRKSREKDENTEIETKTRRRVIRVSDEGEEDVTVRDRNLKNKTMEDVQREIARKNLIFEPLTEEDELEVEDNNNNSNNVAKIQHLSTKDVNGKENVNKSREHVPNEKPTVNGPTSFIIQTPLNGSAKLGNGEITLENIQVDKNNVSTNSSDRRKTKFVTQDTEHTPNSRNTPKRQNRFTRQASNEEEKQNGFTAFNRNTEKIQVSNKTGAVKTFEVVTKIKDGHNENDKLGALKNGQGKEKENRDFESPVRLSIKNEEKPTTTKQPSVTDRFPKRNSANIIRNKFEEKQSIGSSNKNDTPKGFEKKTESKHFSNMADFKSRFENSDNKIENLPREHRNIPPTQNSKYNENNLKHKLKVEENVIIKSEMSLESAAVIDLKSVNKRDSIGKNARQEMKGKTESTHGSRFEKFENNNKDNISQTKRVPINNRKLQTMADFKSKFENKDTVAISPKSPATVQPKSKPEAKSFEPKIKNCAKNEEITSSFQNTERFSKLNKERNGVETKGSTTDLKKVPKPKAMSVEERLRENKKKQEAVKKAQASNAAKGRNAFKQQLEANSSTSGEQHIVKGNSNIDKLLKWIAKRINQYPAVNVTNFTSSWQDGIALCALINYLLGDEAINPLAVSSFNRKKNFEMAIKAASDAGVPALINADEICACEEMDRRSMITYLHTVYKVLFADKQEQQK